MTLKNKKKLKTKSKKYTFIDLFAGIGGFHIAFNKAGAKCVFVSEWDKYAQQTYKNYFEKKEPDLFKSGNFVGDIMSVDVKKIPSFDILTGGFPCQPFSQAGHKRGFKDSRGNLFFKIAEIISIKEPRAFFIENVRHLEKHDNGKTFQTIKHIIEDDLGYSFYPQLVRASDFGLPQHRPRIYMVGFKNKKIQFKFPEPIKLQTTMSDIFGGKVDREIGYTLRVGGRASGINDRRNWDSYIVDGKRRRLTPEEGKKMMGFPKDFHFPVSEAQAMKQLGNSVAVPAITAVAREIVKTLDRHYAK
ncbi:MAG: DNA cytosine methyltransferase [Patescibacteria group bacterium]|jgi:DNA (cytosine-5)-methyltransferase 1